MVGFKKGICGASLVLSSFNLASADNMGGKFVVPSFMKQEQTIDKAGLMRLSRVPFFKSTELTDLHISAFAEREDGVMVDVVSKKSVNYGGHIYPANIRVEGEGNLLQIYLGKSISVTVNGIKICGLLGQHAQTLEIFELKLCEDSLINGLKIPGGSHIAFWKNTLKPGEFWHEISCIQAGKDMTFRGNVFLKGKLISPRTKDGIPNNDDTECRVMIWETIEGLE